ncbi:Uncharacterised protein [Mycobacteroides abscessus subsp. abscessus]|nr:Uncharacterised protein [Mycobacteroides abscessus subsp. abscessus]SLC78906.1 Uncharacterised protein [Mycobacteroides abscessus subsp. massiliense]
MTACPNRDNASWPRPSTDAMTPSAALRIAVADVVGGAPTLSSKDFRPFVSCPVPTNTGDALKAVRPSISAPSQLYNAAACPESPLWHAIAAATRTPAVRCAGSVLASASSACAAAAARSPARARDSARGIRIGSGSAPAVSAAR